ncbi:hypothetical protein FRC01_008389 [Tulasnella sp. 417]|nr:hypothetical protein FRC01_008389 [Tulasnella sp. 417]
MVLAAPAGSNKLLPLESHSGSFTKRGLHLSQTAKIALIVVFVGPIALSVTCIIIYFILVCIAELCSALGRKKKTPEKQKAVENSRARPENSQSEPAGADLGPVEQFVGEVSS